MRVQIRYIGEPFDRAAVAHTLRHLAMRVGWTLTEGEAEHRIVYVTLNDPEDDPFELPVRRDDVVIVTARSVEQFFETAREPIPMGGGETGQSLPFVLQTWDSAIRARGWLSADMIAGAWAVMNLWYETRVNSTSSDGWMRGRDDWWALRGFEKAAAFADEWLEEIARAAVRLGWIGEIPKMQLLGASFVVVLTHDVDYMPSARDGGLPRLLRALARQIWLRRRPGDALQIIWKYAQNWRTNPYWTLDAIREQEKARGARSSFQFVMLASQRFDPTYRANVPPIAPALREMAAGEWEVCLHGSYAASRTAGQLEREKKELEKITGTRVLGHRQHYLNFFPPQLFAEVKSAGLAYDSSVGYNDMTGPRSGTFFPYRPYALDEKRGFAFWEIPFVVMDTTLATTFRDDPPHALQHAQEALAPVIAAGGCVGLVWHAEQSSGLVDPGFDRVFTELLDWIHAAGGLMVSGRALLEELDMRWQTTWVDA